MEGSVADRIGRGLCAVWRRQARMVPGGVVYEADGVIGTLTNLPDQSLNVALVERPPRDAEAALAAAEGWFRHHGYRLGIELEHGRHPEVEDAARALGLRPVMSRPGLARMLDGFAPSSPPPGVSISEVRDRSGLAAIVDIQVSAFSWDRRVAEGFLSPSVLDEPGLAIYLATLDGRPVGSAFAHLDGGAVGIFGVATLRPVRRRGIATAITGRAMADARARADIAWLLATPEGEPVYERMGFRAAGRWVVWVA